MRLAILATLAVTVYIGLCWVLPFGTCRACNGRGFYRALSFTGLRERPCRLCRGAGRRLRWGRRLFNYLARIHHDATTHRNTK